MTTQQKYKSFVALEYLWWGQCIGGKHYTGEIIYHRNGKYKKFELERQLGRKEAKQMAEDQGRLWLARETVTNKFNDFEQLKRAAIQWCENKMGLHWMLFPHDVINIRVPLAASGKFLTIMPMLVDFAKVWESANDSACEKCWDESHKTWESVLDLVSVDKTPEQEQKSKGTNE